MELGSLEAHREELLSLAPWIVGDRPGSRQHVPGAEAGAKALFNRAFALATNGRLSEALDTYEEVVRRFDSRDVPAMQDAYSILFIPSFYYQMTPKISLNIRCSISISKNLSINGRTRSSGQLGIWSYNINP